MLGVAPNHIRKQDPLKQGLKLVSFVICTEYEGIRKQDPLKQGLKLFRESGGTAGRPFESKIH